MLTQESSSKFVAVTPSDSLLLAYNGEKASTKFITVGGTGNVAVKDDVGNTVILTGLVAGVVYPVITEQILNTGTTATGVTAYI